MADLLIVAGPGSLAADWRIGLAHKAYCSVDTGAEGTLSNTVTVVASLSGPLAANNSATDNTTVTPAADLAITKDDGGLLPAPGDSSPTAAGSGDLAELLSLPTGSSVTYTLNCAIDRLAAGSLTYTATVVGSLLDLVSGNNSVTEITALDVLELFSDGFESGGTTAWSNLVP